MEVTDNEALFNRIFTLELQVGFIIPEMIKVMDSISDKKASSCLVIALENIINQLPDTPASCDERFTEAAKRALSAVKRAQGDSILPPRTE